MCEEEGELGEIELEQLAYGCEGRVHETSATAISHTVSLLLLRLMKHAWTRMTFDNITKHHQHSRLMPLVMKGETQTTTTTSSPKSFWIMRRKRTEKKAGMTKTAQTMI